MAHLLAGAGELAHSPDAVDPQQLLHDLQGAIALRGTHAAAAVGGIDHAVDGGKHVALGAGGTGSHGGRDNAGDAGVELQPPHGVLLRIRLRTGLHFDAADGAVPLKSQKLIDLFVGKARHDQGTEYDDVIIGKDDRIL